MTHQTDMDEGTNGLETERSYGVDESLVRTCEIALSAGRIDELDGLIDGLHASDLADLLEALSSDSRRILFDHVRDRLDPELLTHLEAASRLASLIASDLS